MTHRRRIALGGAIAFLLGIVPSVSGAQSADPVAHARGLARSRDFDGARLELQAVLGQQPANTEALEALIYVELWSGHPIRAERLAAEALASDPNHIELLIAWAAALRQLNRKPEALTAMEQAAVLAPDRNDVIALRDLLRHLVRGSEVMMGASYDHWDDGRELWRESQVSIRQNTMRGVAIARLSRARRFGLDNDKLDVEAYPAFRGAYAALGFSYAPDAQLYPSTSASMELFATLPRQLEASLGYRRLNFAEAVDVFIGSLGAYRRNVLWSARVFHVTGGASGNSAMLSARRYFDNDRRSVAVHLAGGTIREDIRTTTDLAALSSASVGADGMLALFKHWSLTLRAGAGRDKMPGADVARRVSGGLGLALQF